MTKRASVLLLASLVSLSATWPADVATPPASGDPHRQPRTAVVSDLSAPDGHPVAALVVAPAAVSVPLSVAAPVADPTPEPTPPDADALPERHVADAHLWAMRGLDPADRAGAPEPEPAPAPEPEDVQPEEDVPAETGPDPELDSTPQHSWSVDWNALADCESGNWVNGGQSFEPGSARWDWAKPGVGVPPWGTEIHHGGLQFHPGTWSSFKSDHHPAYAYDATPDQQKEVAERVLAAQGLGAWPTCTEKLGWR